jgi:hypothetical protein
MGKKYKKDNKGEIIVEGKMNASITLLDDKRTAGIHTHSRRKTEEEKIVKMDSGEFLWMACGGILLGLSIYLLSFLIV